MKKTLSTTIIVSLVLCFSLACSVHAAERDITLQWDESIDAPYLQSYKIYYYTASGDIGSLNAADYAASYTLAGGSPVFLNPATDPKPITIPKTNTQITLRFLDSSKYYFFAVTAVDTRGLESIPTPEIGTAISAQEYVLMTLNPDPGKGTVSGSGINCGDTCLAAYKPATVVSLSAAAAPGSTFAGWSGGGCSGAGPCTVTMNANTTVTATFQASIVNYSITASVSGTGGTISPSGASSVSSGGSRTYSIAPATGYSINSVLVDGISMGAVSGYTFSNVTANHTIVASFKANIVTYSISGSVSGAGGSISPSGASSVTSGSSLTYSITPATGYSINSVLVDGVSIGAVSGYTFSNVTANHTIVASFKANIVNYSISGSVSGAGGSISPSGASSVSSGSSLTYSITPATGYSINSVLVDGISMGAVTNFTFSNVTANHTIVASFKANIVNYSITGSVSGAGGSISPSGASSVTSGGSLTYSITPATGYSINSVLVDGTSMGAVTNFTFSNVTANHTIVASFKANIVNYSITGSVSGAGGSISPSGASSVTSGGSLTYSITPATGYSINSVLVDGTSMGAVTNFTFSNVTANHTIVASFKANIVNYSITGFVSGAGGSISPSGASSVTSGGSLTYSITPATGYSINSVLVDGTSMGAVTNFTFSNVTANHTIVASFKANIVNYSITGSVSGAGGSISPSGASSVTSGGSLTYSITPATGYSINSVLVDGISMGAVTNFSFSNVTANHTIVASFKANIVNYSITASVSGAGGSISPSGASSVSPGGSLTYSIAPATGYSIDRVWVDGRSIGAAGSYTFSNVTANHKITASFKRKRR